MSSSNPLGQNFWTNPTTGINYVRYGEGEWHEITLQVPSPAPRHYVAGSERYTESATEDLRLPPLNFGPPYTQVSNASGSAGPNAPRPRALLAADDEDDLPPAHTLHQKFGQPAFKVAGVRRPTPDYKGKGKARASTRDGSVASTKRKVSTAHSEEPEAKKRRGGRGPGIANYSALDVDALLDIVEETLPIGGRAWSNIGDAFSAWAIENERPLMRTTKPTGDAECPPNVERAHLIEQMINEKADTQELDDSDIADDIIEISDDEDEANMAPPASKKTVVKTEPGTKGRVTVKTEPSDGPIIARRTTNDRLPASRTSRTTAQDLLRNITTALDPATQTSRSEDRNARTLQTTQLLTLSNQLRDATSTVENLRTRLLETERDRSAAERRADKAESRAEMLTLMSGGLRRPRSPSPVPRRFRQEIFYPDGGRATQFLTGLESPPPHSPQYPAGTRFITEEDPFSPVQAAMLRKRRDTRVLTTPHPSVRTTTPHAPHRETGRTANTYNSIVESDQLEITVTPSRTAQGEGVSFVVTPKASSSSSSSA